MKTNHQDRDKVIPPRIAFHVAFLPEGLSSRQYKEEVRRIVKQCQKYLLEDALCPCLIEFCDEELADIVHEVLQEN